MYRPCSWPLFVSLLKMYCCVSAFSNVFTWLVAVLSAYDLAASSVLVSPSAAAFFAASRAAFALFVASVEAAFLALASALFAFLVASAAAADCAALALLVASAFADASVFEPMPSAYFLAAASASEVSRCAAVVVARSLALFPAMVLVPASRNSPVVMSQYCRPFLSVRMPALTRFASKTPDLT